jgi:hypothetical protein
MVHPLLQPTSYPPARLAFGLTASSAAAELGVSAGSNSFCNGRRSERHHLFPPTLKRPSLQMRRALQQKEPLLRGRSFLFSHRHLHLILHRYSC